MPTGKSRPQLEPPPLPEPQVEKYNRVADVIGFVPTARWKDQVYQAVVVVTCTLVGAGAGYLLAPKTPGGHEPILYMVLGGVGGMILSTLVSGLTLMVMGWRRAQRARNGSSRR